MIHTHISLLTYVNSQNEIEILHSRRHFSPPFSLLLAAAATSDRPAPPRFHLRSLRPTPVSLSLATHACFSSGVNYQNLSPPLIPLFVISLLQKTQIGTISLLCDTLRCQRKIDATVATIVSVAAASVQQPRPRLTAAWSTIGAVSLPSQLPGIASLDCHGPAPPPSSCSSSSPLPRPARGNAAAAAVIYSSFLTVLAGA